MYVVCVCVGGGGGWRCISVVYIVCALAVLREVFKVSN